MKLYSKTAVAGTIMAVLVMGAPLVSLAATLNRELQVGSTGNDVSAVQSFLAKDVTLYPQGLVTGYFGFLTKAAVSNFQSRNGIAAVGRIGPQTLPVMNFQMDQGIVNGGGQSNTTSDVISTINSVNISTSRNSANVSWYTNMPATGKVYYSTSPLNLNEHYNSVDVSGNVAMTDNSYATSQNVSISGLQANTTYYFLVYSVNQIGNASITWPATFTTAN